MAIRIGCASRSAAPLNSLLVTGPPVLILVLLDHGPVRGRQGGPTFQLRLAQGLSPVIMAVSEALDVHERLAFPAAVSHLAVTNIGLKYCPRRRNWRFRGGFRNLLRKRCVVLSRSIFTFPARS